MPKKTKEEEMTEIVCVIDRSSSMSPTQREVIDGFNNFIKEQKKQPGLARVSLTLFDTRYEPLLESKPITEISDDFLTTENYQPSGMTALLDATGRTIDALNERVGKLKKKHQPDKVIFLIMTDGEENSSQEYTGDKIKELVNKHEKKNKWEFVFLGANIDSFSTGGQLGFSAANTANYSQAVGATCDAFTSVARTVTRYRKSGVVSLDVNDKGEISN